MKRLTIILFLLPLQMVAQNSYEIEKLLESHDITESEDSYQEIIQNLTYLAEHPLDINTATFDDLRNLYFLSDSQIDNILNLRKSLGQFTHFQELRLAIGISQKDIESIKLFINIGDYKYNAPPRTNHEILAKIRFILPLQDGYKKYKREAFVNEIDFIKKNRNRFKGPPFGSTLKYKSSISQWQYGITLENDPGESYFTKHQKNGFDFLSAHAQFRSNKFINKIILGDFKIKFGQGLTIWNGFSFGKNSFSNGNSGEPLSPYTSSNETNFLRGVAVTLKSSNLQSDIFLSYKSTHATLSDSTASLYTAGYHRNLNEIDKKDNIKELTTGFSIKWNNEYFKISFNILHYNFSIPLTIGDKPYQQYYDNGKNRTLLSIDYRTGYKKFYFQGETAVSDNKSIATLNTLRYSGLNRLKPILIYRYYDKKYTSQYSNSFGEYSKTTNEQGVYAGIEYFISRKLTFSGYFDWFQYFSPRYLAEITGSGTEYLAEILFSHRKFVISARHKSESKPEDYKVNDILHSTQRIKNESRIQFNYTATHNIELRTRFTYNEYEKLNTKEKGHLFYQDIILTSNNKRFKTQYRFSYFNTDSYNTRIYSYENNVLYGYSFPTFYDKGFRTYLNMNYKICKHITYYFKIGFTYYLDREQIGSSLTKIDDNKSYDLALQIRIKI